jgi:hypothetical protein
MKRRRRHRSRLTIESLEPRVVLAASQPASQPFAYLLDHLTDENIALTMPVATSSTVVAAVIGEAGAADRKKWTSDWKTSDDVAVDARIVGESLALHDDAAGRSLWPRISPFFTSATPVAPAAKHDLAVSILTAVMVDTAAPPGAPGSEFPLPAEAAPTADGGFVIWAQDFEFAPGGAVTNEVYAGITAVLWAGRQLLTESLPSGQPAMKVVPVPSSSIFKTLGDATQGYLDTAAILQGSGGIPYLASLGLAPLPRTNVVTATNPHGEWNFLSTLYANGLIDGFLGQQYAIDNSAAAPGSVSADTLAFYPGQDLPYAILSAHDNPAQLTTPQPQLPPPPWPSHHAGGLPFAAGVYWSQLTIDPLAGGSGPGGFDPAAVLVPTVQPLAADHAVRPTVYDFNGDGVGDEFWRSEATGGAVAVLRTADGGDLGRRFLGGDADWAVEASGDFDGNGATDLIWRHESGMHVQWLLRGDGSIGASRVLDTTDRQRAAMAADFDGDGKTDLAWRDGLSGQTDLWLFDGDRVVERAVVGGDLSWRLVRLSQNFDGNGDGRADLLWHHADSGATVAWFMDGVRPAAARFMGGDPKWLPDDTGDFDGDGGSDLVWRQVVTGAAIARPTRDSGRGDIALGGDADWRIVSVRNRTDGGGVEVFWREAASGFVVVRVLEAGTAAAEAVIGGGRGWTLLGRVAPAQPNLVLWHEGYKTDLSTLFEAEAWTRYTSSIVEFASTHGIGTVMASLIFGSAADTLPADVIPFLNSFVAAVERAGMTAGISVAFGSQTTFPEAAETLAGIVHDRPLLIGVDAENFVGTSIPVPTAMTVMDDVVRPFEAALQAAGVAVSGIAVIGGMASNPSWTAPLDNVYEYYSDANGTLNSLFAGDRDDPVKAWTDFSAAVAHAGGGIVNPATIGGWPAFAISRNDDECLGGCTADPGKLYPCGIADIFGQWSWTSFAGFLEKYQAAYAPGAIVIYQGDQLPCDWLGAACPT